MFHDGGVEIFVVENIGGRNLYLLGRRREGDGEKNS
jgi:hypothetical protein